MASVPSGAFQATVRYKAPPDGQIRTFVLDAQPHAMAGEALAHAKELAMKWARERSGDVVERADPSAFEPAPQEVRAAGTAVALGLAQPPSWTACRRVHAHPRSGGSHA